MFNDVVYQFHPEKFNPVSPLGSNLLYALPTRMLAHESLSQEPNFLRLLREEGVVQELSQMSFSLIDGLVATFGTDGVEHPLFHRLNLDEKLYHRLTVIASRIRVVGHEEMDDNDLALILSVPFTFSAEEMGAAITEEFKRQVLEIHMRSSMRMVEELDGLFSTIDPNLYMPVMTVLGNAIFGRVSNFAGAKEKRVEDIVVDVLSKHGLRRLAAQSIYSLTTTEGGKNLPTVFRERIAFSRAGIKKPDVLILGNALASHDSVQRRVTRDRISELMPDATLIYIENEFQSPESYDLFIEIVDGRIDGSAAHEQQQDPDARQDLNRKLQVVAQAELFAELDQKQQRLLAFSAQWYKTAPGKVIFERGQAPDAAYLCVEGHAGLYWPVENGENQLISDIHPGSLVGDLAVFTDSPHQLNLVSSDDTVFLRIGSNELNAVIENDAKVATSVLKKVASHISTATQELRSTREYAIEQGVDFSELDERIQK